MAVRRCWRKRGLGWVPVLVGWVSLVGSPNALAQPAGSPESESQSEEESESPSKAGEAETPAEMQTGTEESASADSEPESSSGAESDASATERASEASEPEPADIAADGGSSVESQPAPTEDPASGETPIAEEAPSLDESLSEHERPERKALLLHAEGLAAENARNYGSALQQLRAALGLDPDNDRIRFDLARVALLHGGERSDLRPFYDAPTPADPGAQALHAAVERELESSLVVSGRDEWLQGSLRLGVTVDSNVAITPDEPTPFQSPTGAPVPVVASPEPLFGARSVLDGLLLIRAIQDPELSVDGIFSFRIGTFLNSEEGQQFEVDGGTVVTPGLEFFDAQRFALGGRVGSQLGSILLRGGVQGLQVTADGFGESFLRSLGADFEALYGNRISHVGLYAHASALDFGPSNPDATDFDRDGTILGGGLTFGSNLGGAFGFSAQLGVFDESPQGAQLEVKGGRLDFAFLSQVGPVSGALGARNQVRVYTDGAITNASDVSDLRVDGLIQPYARLIVGITDHLGVYGVYGYSQNLSTHDENILPSDPGRLHIDRTFQRHFAEFGVEGRL